MNELSVVVYGQVATLGYVTAYVRADDHGRVSGYFVAPRDVPFDVGEACLMQTTDGRSEDIEITLVAPEGAGEQRVNFRG